MNTFIVYIGALLMLAAAGFAEDIVLDNLTAYPKSDQKSKIAIQWASSAQEVDDGNKASILGLHLKADALLVISKSGKISIAIPKTAQYFRVLVWAQSEGEPDFLTNWVDIVPNKTYTLEAGHLVPSQLMLGTGC